MSIEPGPSSSPQNDFGSLQGCFVEGSPEQRKRERRIRRRALIISVAAQAAILAAIILLPLFGKPAHIAFAMTPVPPYFHNSGPAHPASPPRDPSQHNFRVIRDLPLTVTPNPPHPIADRFENMPEAPEFPTGPGASTPCVGCITLDDNRHQPPPPPPPPTPHRLLVAHLEPAMLIQRVEPIYPALPKQMHREGQVELRAVIATDGTIQSLQVVSGDPLFVRSATDAVSQWRYRPTVLNGQPVEIETYITVIYTLQH
jgi:periplasmic protein TonB